MQFAISFLLFLAFSSSYEPKSIPAAEEATLHSDARGADVPSVAAGAPGSPANSRTARVTRGSAASTDPTSSLQGTLSSSGTGTRHPNGSREATDLPEPPGEPLLTSSLSASESTFRGKFVSLKAGCFGAGQDFTSPRCFFFRYGHQSLLDTWIFLLPAASGWQQGWWEWWEWISAFG